MVLNIRSWILLGYSVESWEIFLKVIYLWYFYLWGVVCNRRNWIDQLTKLMRYYKLFFLLLIVLGCEDDDLNDDQEFRKYTGDYIIVSFKSDVAVDLNKDDIASYELTNEINTFGYDDLRIRPNGNESGDKKLLNFLFPKTFITFKSPGQPEGRVEFLDYGFGTFYQFKDNIFKLKDTSYVEGAYIDNVEADKVVNLDRNLMVVDPDHLKFTIHKEYYDFITDDWIRLNIEVLYKKL